jgi:hypothetical protein
LTRARARKRARERTRIATPTISARSLSDPEFGDVYVHEHVYVAFPLLPSFLSYNLLPLHQRLIPATSKSLKERDKRG